MGWGIKIRVAHMPTLSVRARRHPPTPGAIAADTTKKPGGS
jgi:hypothetical protein